ncbi:hypothetical protein ADIAL_2036 [Alkalibacterium sp. AK22]|uniref:hypothetical protein n=1 Tax=Alkalibacterium sp. AK22 TaxID=1229520 RepID=UPI00044E7251|nr:hypothetical protein [Alkalibacterium sp. AK22]EXJ22450.1 hypothetical protein ADIAL_2036 [Alkalibacterium sp. AK22]
MTKKNIRILASGFLLSGLMILLIHSLGPVQSEAADQEKIETLEAEINFLEGMIADLEMENERLASEYGVFADLDDSIEEEASSAEADQDRADETEEAADESQDSQGDDAVEHTVVIGEGQPSSVIASQLQSFGMIDDVFAFNDYMEDNDLIRRVRPGSYVVRTDMNRDQIIEAIIR